MRKLAMLLILALCLTVVSFPVSAVTGVSTVDLAELDVPLAGAKPDTTVTMRTSGYQIYSLDWYDVTADRYLNAGDKFIDGNVYRVVIWLEAKEGWEFVYTDSRTPAVAAKVNGKTAQVNKAYEYNAWAMIEVCYTFPATPSKWVSSLNIQLEGITKNGNVLCAPEDGYIPFAIRSASEDISVYPQLNTNRYYPHGFRWSDIGSNAVKYDGERFKGGREYYVHIAIKLNEGGFRDDLAVTINGKAATIKTRGQDFAEIGVEVTCFGGIVANDIRPVVILPKDGNYPDMAPTYAYPQCEHIDYASVIGWYDVETGKRLYSDDKFTGGKQYRVEICCMAAYPYKFARDANDKMQYSPQITGWDVDSYYFGYDDYRGRELIYISKTFTAETRDHTCVAGPWISDEGAHERFCTTCGTSFGGGAHWSSGDATCAHGKLCDVCGYEFTKPTEAHTPDTKWTACGNLYHAKLCTVCGAHCDPQDHIPGPEATETAAQKCTECGYVITPAKNHKHQIREVAATEPDCTHTGNRPYYMCTGCEQLFADKDGKTPLTESVLLPATGHTPGAAWNEDGQYHWRNCTECGEVLTETKAAHDAGEGGCAICSYQTGSGEAVPETTEPDATKPDATEPPVNTENTEPDRPAKPVEPVQAPADTEPAEENARLLILLVAAGGFAAATAVTVFVLKKKKK